MAKIRETEVRVDDEGHEIGRTEHIVERPKRGGGGFGWGLLFGVILVAGAITLWSYNQGSFQTAGRQADQATQVAQEQVSGAVDSTQQALNDNTESNTAANSGDTATN